MYFAEKVSSTPAKSFNFLSSSDNFWQFFKNTFDLGSCCWRLKLIVNLIKNQQSEKFVFPCILQRKVFIKVYGFKKLLFEARDIVNLIKNQRSEKVVFLGIFIISGNIAICYIECWRNFKCK